MQLAHLVGRDDAILEAAKAGGNAVNDAPLGHELLNGRPRSHHRRHSRRVEADGAAVGHRYNVIHSKFVAGEEKSVHVAIVAGVVMAG